MYFIEIHSRNLTEKNKTKQNKTKNKTKQNKTKQNKTKQNKTTKDDKQETGLKHKFETNAIVVAYLNNSLLNY